jgi:hypothetical protein
LTLSFGTKFLDVLALDKEARAIAAKTFAAEVHQEIANLDDNEFIDWHKNAASKLICEHLGNFGLFRTQTRRKLALLDEECAKLNPMEVEPA